MQQCEEEADLPRDLRKKFLNSSVSSVSSFNLKKSDMNMRVNQTGDNERTQLSIYLIFFSPILFFVPDDLINILTFFATVVRFDQQMAAFTRDTQHQVSGPAHDTI